MKKQQQWEETLNYRRTLLEQIAEQEEKKKMDKIEEIAWFNRTLKASSDDKRFFEYAKEVLEQAKSKGRPTYPIKKVIEVSGKVENIECQLCYYHFFTWQKYRRDLSLIPSIPEGTSEASNKL